MDLLKVARVPAILATPETSVRQAVELMEKKCVGAIVITDADEHVLGMFTERDLVRRVAARDREINTTLMWEVMSTPVVSVPANTTIEDGLALMNQRHFRHLPVVDSANRILGIVSLRYLLMRRTAEKEAALGILSAYVNAGGPG